MRRSLAKLLLATVLAAAVPWPAAANLRAIVAGFNDYAAVAKLQGAVADADDIAAVLARRGVQDLVKVTERSTTVTALRAQFDAMIARAAPGDTILFTFSGHGIRVPEKRVPKRTPDGYDKGFLLPTYDQKARPDEILRDEDLYDLFQASAAKGIQILFVVDACHAGTGLRGADTRGGGGTFKFQQFDLGPGVAVAPPPKETKGPRPPIVGVAAITAQIAEKTVQELPIDGKLRGVLSYAVARGLEGAADPDRTGAVTLDMLWRYVRPEVFKWSENRQAPTLFAREADGTMPILMTAAAPPPPPAPDLIEPDSVGIFAMGAPSLPSIRGGTFITDRSRAELIWDGSRRQILNAPGDILASSIDAAALQGAVDARRLLSFLRKAGEKAGGLETRIALLGAPPGSRDDRFYKAGERVRFEVATGPFKYLTVFDVNSDGQVQFLYPALTGDTLENTSPTPLSSVDPAVREPFGGDFVVFVRTDQPLLELHAEFMRAKDQTLPASRAYEIVRKALRGSSYRIGIQGLFTCRNILESGQCE